MTTLTTINTDKIELLMAIKTSVIADKVCDYIGVNGPDKDTSEDSVIVVLLSLIEYQSEDIEGLPLALLYELNGKLLSIMETVSRNGGQSSTHMLLKRINQVQYGLTRLIRELESSSVLV